MSDEWRYMDADERMVVLLSDIRDALERIAGAMDARNTSATEPPG